jgi:hypothetical protein
MTDKICKHHVKGVCNKNDKCEFKHIDNICRFHFFGKCRDGDTCKASHLYKLNGNSNSKSPYKLVKGKNTESFIPSDKPADMRIVLGDSSCNQYNNIYKSRDIILVQNLFSDMPDVFENLLAEIKNNTNEDVWKLWHGDSHMIADDHIMWKSKCPTFAKVLERLKTYFKLNVKATRLNWYRDSTDWKPYHHDAAAIDPKKAKTQNLTVGVSFGATRDASFEHAKTKTTIDFPLTNGSVYCFGPTVNVEWRHGIPQNKDKDNSGERISIIAWSWVEMSD